MSLRHFRQCSRQNAGHADPGSRRLCDHPFQNGINQIGAYLTDCLTGFQNVKKLSAEKEELEQKVTDLTEENNQLVQDQQELQRLQELYQLDQSYSEYEK